MIKSRKSGSNINAKFNFSGIKRVFADREPADAGASYAPLFALAA